MGAKANRVLSTLLGGLEMQWLPLLLKYS